MLTDKCLICDFMSPRCIQLVSWLPRKAINKILDSIIKRKKKQNAWTRNTYGDTYLALPSYHRFQAKALRMFSGAKPVHKHGTENKAISVITTQLFFDFETLLQQQAETEKNCPLSTSVWCQLPTTEDKRKSIVNGCGIISTISKSCQAGRSLMVLAEQV